MIPVSKSIAHPAYTLGVQAWTPCASFLVNHITNPCFKP